LKLKDLTKGGIGPSQREGGGTSFTNLATKGRGIDPSKEVSPGDRLSKPSKHKAVWKKRAVY